MNKVQLEVSLGKYRKMFCETEITYGAFELPSHRVYIIMYISLTVKSVTLHVRHKCPC